jgi:hypothetical protein
MDDLDVGAVRAACVRAPLRRCADARGIHTVREEALVRNAMSRSIARVVAVLAMVLATVGALSLLNKANTGPSTAVASGCREFETEALKLFGKGDSTALSGTFAPGDHVRLVIDFAAVDFSWKLTGVLGKANKADVFGTGARFTKTIDSDTHIRFIPYPRSTTTTLHSGTVSGTGKLNLEIDVTKAGDGGIAINMTSSAPLSTPPSVAIASCNASKTAHLL